MKTTMKAALAGLVLFVLVAVGLLAGCSSQGGGSFQGGTVTVIIKDLRFNPPVVTIRPGTKVRWLNQDETAHTSTSADYSADATTQPAGAWNSPILDPGRSWTRTFDAAGTFPYACSIHPYIKGTVKVTQ